MRQIKFFDSTLRDGSHAVKQQISVEHITNYCRMVDAVGMYTVIVGHGNGLGASSIQMGFSAIDELAMLDVARKNLNKTMLGTFVTVGFGTIVDYIRPAINLGVDVFCIAAHCTEADTTKKHIEYLAEHGKKVYGVLMNVHMCSAQQLLQQAKLIQSYGADGIILMDSAGTMTPEMVEEKIGCLSNELSMEVGFHPHNNLSMAVSNAYTAIKNGAGIVDGTVGGFGAGAGNCQLEALLALLKKEGYPNKMKLYPLLDVAREVIQGMFGYNKLIDSESIVSGYAGVVSTFKEKVNYTAKMYNVDARDIFIELGKRNAVAGQDDLILEVAQYLSSNSDRRNL